MDAAAALTPEERQEMIKGMVNQLSERLASEGGLARRMGSPDRSAWCFGRGSTRHRYQNEAMEVFAGNAEAIELIDAAALQAGIAQ